MSILMVALLSVFVGGGAAAEPAAAKPVVGESVVGESVAGERAAIGEEPALLDTYWIMESVLDGEDEIPLPPSREPYLILHASGQFEGYNGCNWVSGAAKATADEIVFSGFGTTKRFCSDYSIGLEIAVNAALGNGRATYRIQDGRLDIARADGHGLRLRAQA